MNTQPETLALVPALTTAERQAIETFYAAWQAKKPELLSQVCTPDWQDIPRGPGQVPGPEGLGHILQKFTTAFPDTEVVIHEIFGTHERAGVRAEIRFTNSRDVPGLATTGRQVSIALHEFHYLKDGKLTHTWHLEAGEFQAYAQFALK